LEAVGFKAPEVTEVDWREQIKDEDAKKFAESSTDVNHLVQRALDMRKTLSNAVVKPGEDATEEQIAAYQKALGIPAKVEDYEFPALPEGQVMTDAIRDGRLEWAKRFHDLGVPQATATALMELVSHDNSTMTAAELKAAKDYVERSEAALKELWPGEEYKTNVTLAKRAAEGITAKAGVNYDDFINIETGDGRLLGDHPDFVRVLAAIGREQTEGTMGPTLTQTQRETVLEQIGELHAKIAEAQYEGNNKLANQLYQKELVLQKQIADEPVPGSGTNPA
jgi:hypothetical protein